MQFDSWQNNNFDDLENGLYELCQNDLLMNEVKRGHYASCQNLAKMYVRGSAIERNNVVKLLNLNKISADVKVVQEGCSNAPSVSLLVGKWAAIISSISTLLYAIKDSNVMALLKEILHKFH